MRIRPAVNPSYIRDDVPTRNLLQYNFNCASVWIRLNPLISAFL